jgi:hypothetical protein
VVLRRRGVAITTALLLVGACGIVGGVLSAATVSASSGSTAGPARHHPSPTPTPSPTQRPTPTPSPTEPPPAPTAAPVPTATPAPSSAPAAGAGDPSALPYSGAPLTGGSAQAVAIAPTPEDASAVSEAAFDTQNLFWLITLAVMAIPLLIVMTLLATVLTRR